MPSCRPVSRGWPLPDSPVAAKPRYPNAPQYFPSPPSALGNKDRQVGCRTEYPVHGSLFVHMAQIIKTVPQRRSAVAVTSLLIGILDWCQNMRARRSSNTSNRKRSMVAAGRSSCRRRKTSQALRFRLWITYAKSIAHSPSFTAAPPFHCPASELRGSNLVELRMNANSEVT